MKLLGIRQNMVLCMSPVLAGLRVIRHVTKWHRRPEKCLCQSHSINTSASPPQLHEQWEGERHRGHGCLPRHTSGRISRPSLGCGSGGLCDTAVTVTLGVSAKSLLSLASQGSAATPSAKERPMLLVLSLLRCDAHARTQFKNRDKDKWLN